MVAGAHAGPPGVAGGIPHCRSPGPLQVSDTADNKNTISVIISVAVIEWVLDKIKA